MKRTNPDPRDADDPFVIANAILKLNDAPADETRFQCDRRLQKAYDLKHYLAERFGERYGWRVTKKPFSLRQLAQESNAQRRREIPEHFYPAMDHCTYYRQTVIRYRPAAIVAHLYNWPDCRPEVETLAGTYGLKWSAIDDYPSWWLPGFTHFILYTPFHFNTFSYHD